MIKNIFEFLGGLGFVMLIISICMYIQAKGDTQKADELLREEIKKATEKAGYILSDDPAARRHNEKNMEERLAKSMISNTIFFIIARFIAFIGVIIFFAWLIISIKNGEWNGLLG